MTLTRWRRGDSVDAKSRECLHATQSQTRSKGEQRKASSRVKGERLQSRCSLLSEVTRVEVCRGVGKMTCVCACSQAGAMGVVVRYARRQEGGAGLGERGCARLRKEDVWARSHDGRRGDGGRNGARGTGACVDSRGGGVGEAAQLSNGDGMQRGSGGGVRRWITCNRGGRVNEAGKTEEDGVETRTSLCLYFTSFTFHPTALLLSIHSELPISC